MRRERVTESEVHAAARSQGLANLRVNKKQDVVESQPYKAQSAPEEQPNTAIPVSAQQEHRASETRRGAKQINNVRR